MNKTMLPPFAAPAHSFVQWRSWISALVLALIVALPAHAQDAENPEEPSPESAEAASAPDVAEDVPIQDVTGPIDVLVNPIYLPEQAELVYQPLISYLREVTGLDLRLTTVRNFHRYWLEARRDSAAPLILEDSHMASWRMNNHGYTPLVTTERPVTFSLLASNASMEPSLSEFVGKRVSTLPSPSLGFLILTEWYDNPLQQPVILSNATSWLDAVEIVFSMEADAAVVPRAIAEKYPNLITVATSEELPGVTLSAAPEIPESTRQALIDAMVVLHDDSEHHAALFELDVDRFVPADPADYTDLDRWLDNIFSL